MTREERMIEWLVCGWDDETLERDESWFQGVFEPIPFEDLGTIEMLRADIAKQKMELANGTHEEGYLIPWCNENEVQITQDGAYIWDDDIQDYKQVLIETIYEKEWYDDSLIEGHRNRKNYFAIIVY